MERVSPIWLILQWKINSNSGEESWKVLLEMLWGEICSDYKGWKLLQSSMFPLHWRSSVLFCLSSIVSIFYLIPIVIWKVLNAMFHKHFTFFFGLLICVISLFKKTFFLSSLVTLGPYLCLLKFQWVWQQSNHYFCLEKNKSYFKISKASLLKQVHLWKKLNFHGISKVLSMFEIMTWTFRTYFGLLFSCSKDFHWNSFSLFLSSLFYLFNSVPFELLFLFVEISLSTEVLF